MIGHYIQHQLQVVFLLQRLGQIGKRQIVRLQVFINLVKVDPPVTMVSGLATITTATVGNGAATTKCRIRVIDNGCDPDGGKTQVANIRGIVEQALEVAPHITDKGLSSVRPFETPFPGWTLTRLFHVVIARVTIHKTVRHYQIDRLLCPRLTCPKILKLWAACCLTPWLTSATNQADHRQWQPN